jgi:2-hydroxymuconate-semialdehyde hydrolase
MAETKPQLETQTVRAGRYSTLYHRMGAGKERAIVFLHGSGPGASALGNWKYALPVMSGSYDCIAPDLQGYGNSEHPAHPPQGMPGWMDLWVEQVIGLLDALGLQTVDLVGNSMGGDISLHLMDRHPERFSRAVLMGSPGVPFRITPILERGWGFYRHPNPSRELLRGLMRGFLYDPAKFNEEVEQVVAARWEDVNREEVRRSFSAMFSGDLQKAVDDLALPEASLRAINQRVLLTHAREDQYVPVSTSLTLVQLLPNAQLHGFDHCGHWISIEKRQAFHQLVMAFLAGQLD